MKTVKILDCTLRDGGYVNNWKFGKDNIKSIIDNLVEGHIDIIETGFIRSVKRNEDSSVFSSIQQIAEMIMPKKQGTLYAAMIEQHNFNKAIITAYDGASVDIIRLTFRQNEWYEAKKSALFLMEKGYKVCIQPVGTSAYDDDSLLRLIHEVNELEPYAFYLVDTLGMMYRPELLHFFYLIDSKLNENICLGFHSHNNLQMSFANAQEIVNTNQNREIIIDTSCYGMGRGAGNLATELFADYINNNIQQKYALVPILNIVDKYLMSIYTLHRWGYDLPYFISARINCHPNYASYLMTKDTLSVERIEQLLSLIPNLKRSQYDEQYIENLYVRMQSCEVEDSLNYQKIMKIVKDKKVLILGSGDCIKKCKEDIKQFACENGCIVISINFIPNDFDIDVLFVSNERRIQDICWGDVENVIATSNLRGKIPQESLVLNYSDLLGEGDSNDNSGAMLIKILKKTGISKLYIAGFDGFEVNKTNNYSIPSLNVPLDYEAMQKKNYNISKQLKLALNGVNYELLTRTQYEI